MRTHEMLIQVDDDFTGTTSEVREYLKVCKSSQLTKYANLNKSFRGHRLKKLGMIKRVAVYGLYDDQGNLVFKGTSDEISDKYFIGRNCGNYVRKNNRMLGKYTVKKLGIVDVLEKKI